MVLHTRGRVGSRRFFSRKPFERNLGGLFCCGRWVVAKVAMASQHTGREAKGEENRKEEIGTMGEKGEMGMMGMMGERWG